MKNLPERRIRFMRVRIALLAVVLLAGAGAIVKRAWELQVRQAPRLREMAEGQYLKGIQLSPQRGTIYDRNGAELAVSVEVDSLFVDPRRFRESKQNPAQVAAKLAGLLGLPRKAIAEKLARERNFAWIKRRLSPNESRAVRALDIPGIGLTTESRRYYPNRELASHVLGFANVDGRGIEGLELELDDRLRGSSALVPAIRDRRGKVIYAATQDDSATHGDDVTLSLDKTIQYLAERELELTVRTFEARAGSAVAIDPRTGEILAMANFPTFNANQPASAPAANRRNRSITDRFEPGSTLKPFTLAGALASDPSLADRRIDCERGAMRLSGYTIHDTHPWADLTPTEILVHSSNIGVAKIGLHMGAATLHRTMRAFGFGTPTGVGLPGETGGMLRDPKLWYEVDAATISFGQGIGVTTLQLATSMAALANQGRLLRPSLIKHIESASGAVTQPQPSSGRQVVPPRIAAALTNMLTAVTGEGGTGTEATIDGIPVAGKTGTAQKPDAVHGGYADNQWVSSFVGFAPADDPRLVIAVVIDEPVIAHYGGTVAAPAFRRIMQGSLRHLDVAPAGPGVLPPAPEPGVARALPQPPAPRVVAPVAQSAWASSEALANARGPKPLNGVLTVPDLLGRTTRTALIAAREAGLDVALRGTGVVVSQSPAAGASARSETTIEATLAPPPAAPRDRAGAPQRPGPLPVSQQRVQAPHARETQERRDG